MRAEDLGRVHFVEAVRIARRAPLVAFALVKPGAVGGDRDHHVALVQLQAARGLDGAQQVGDPGQAEAGEAVHQRRGPALARHKIGLALAAVEQQVEGVRALIGDADHQVAVHDVVDERHVLVADALDVVRAVAVVEQGRAFDRFDHRDARAQGLLQVVAGAQRPGRAAAGDEGGQAQVRVGRAQILEDPLERAAGAQVVGQVVAELGELVDDHVGRVALQLGADVVDLLDVALRARRADHVRGVRDPLVQPLEALGAHALGQHRHAAAAQDARDRHAAAAVVARRRPDRALCARVEAPGDDARHQAGVGGEHLVCPDHREALAERHHDARRNPGQAPRHLDIAGRLDPAGPRRVVVPMDPEQVGRVGRVRVGRGEPGEHRLGDGPRNGRRLGQLREARQQDAGLAQGADRARLDGGIAHLGRKVERVHGSGSIPVSAVDGGRTGAALCRPPAVDL